MKILVGGIYHESHSFSNVRTDVDSFRDVLLLEGPESIDQMRGTTSEMAGFILGSEKFAFEMVPTLWAWGLSTGPVEEATLEYFLNNVAEAIKRTGGIDGVLFALHGAMVAKQSLDGDGYVLSRLRDLVGDEIPIVVTLDLHANISELMVEKATAIVGYDTYPHIDQVERGLEAAEIMMKTIRRDIRPVMAIAKPAMVVVPHTQLTDHDPMKRLLSLAHEIEHQEGVISVTVAGGFAYADVPEIGPSIVVVTNNDAAKAESCAKRLAAEFEDSRDAFVPALVSVEHAVSKAVAAETYPVILADVGDNIGAGTPGDSTFILEELIRQNADSAVLIIADSGSVDDAINAGVGHSVHLSVGGKTDGLHGTRIALNARVKLISNGVFINRGHMRDGIVEKMGRTAVVDIGGIKIVLTERKMPPWNLEQLRSVGIIPENEKIIVVKSAVAFRAAYEPIAGEIIEVNTPGLSTVDLTQFEYKHIRRPIFPFDSTGKETGRSAG